VTNEELFWQLAGELMRQDTRVEEGTIMKGRCLRAHGEFVALPDFKGAGLVVKLSRSRVQELLEAGVGESFAPAGRVFKEWVSVPLQDAELWGDLMRESVERAVRAARG